MYFSKFLFLTPKKFGGGKTPKFRQISPNGRQTEIHNFETARHIDKRIADLSSTINGLKDGTKFGGHPQPVLMQPGRKIVNYKFRTKILEFCPLAQNFLL